MSMSTGSCRARRQPRLNPDWHAAGRQRPDPTNSRWTEESTWKKKGQPSHFSYPLPSGPLQSKLEPSMHLVLREQMGRII
jgi:hypothetical protein